MSFLLVIFYMKANSRHSVVLKGILTEKKFPILLLHKINRLFSVQKT